MAEKASSSTEPASGSSKPQRDLVQRGKYGDDFWGKATFIAFRAIDPFIQYSILAHGAGTGLLHRVGLRTLPPGIPTHTGISAIDALGLSPYRLILLGMTVGSALKQSVWVLQISRESLGPKNSLIIGLFNIAWNAIGTYAFLLSSTSASTTSTFPQPPLIVGCTLYTVGLLTEYISELQRKRFKDDPANKGKPYTGGLWKLARHINYGAYSVWRAGFATAAGGWGLGALTAAFFLVDFAKRGVPVLNEYCEKRYGADWEAFKKQTPYVLIPGIY